MTFERTVAILLSSEFGVVLAEVTVSTESPLVYRQVRSNLRTRPLENGKEGLGDRLGWKCTKWNVWNV